MIAPLAARARRAGRMKLRSSPGRSRSGGVARMAASMPSNAASSDSGLAGHPDDLGRPPASAPAPDREPAAYRTTTWCRARSLALFAVRRADIESFARDLEARGRARATVTQQLRPAGSG